MIFWLPIFSAAEFLKEKSTDGIRSTIQILWIVFYLELPGHFYVGQGTAYTSRYTPERSESAEIKFTVEFEQ